MSLWVSPSAIVRLLLSVNVDPSGMLKYIDEGSSECIDRQEQRANTITGRILNFMFLNFMDRALYV
jgi:hypothetical protein